MACYVLFSIGTDSAMEVKEEPGAGASIQSPAYDSDSDAGDFLELADSNTTEIDDIPKSAGNYTSEVVFSLSKIISRSLGLQPQKLQVLSNCCRPR